MYFLFYVVVTVLSLLLLLLLFIIVSLKEIFLIKIKQLHFDCFPLSFIILLFLYIFFLNSCHFFRWCCFCHCRCWCCCCCCWQNIQWISQQYLYLLLLVSLTDSPQRTLKLTKKNLQLKRLQCTHYIYRTVSIYMYTVTWE